MSGIKSAFDALPLYRQPNWQPPQKVNYLALGLGFIVVEQAFEIYLTLRQRRYLQRTKLPDDLVEAVASISGEDKKVVKAPSVQDMDRKEGSGEPETLVDQLKSKFLGSRSYNLDKINFSMIKMAYGTLTGVAFLLSGFSAWSWTQSQHTVEYLGGIDWAGSEVAVGSAFLVFQSIVSAIIGLPISYISSFVVEEKHGFNKMTLSTFISDIFKGLLVEALVAIPLMGAITKVVRWGGSQFWIYAWMLMFVFSIAMLTIVPNLIMPLFNTFIPLEQGELRQAIEKVAASLEYPLKKLYEVDGSKRSTHSNAYLYGFWKDKRIVLFDTLIRNKEEPQLECTTDEIVAIVGHELGHWKLSHTVKGFVLQNAMFLLTFWGFSAFVSDADMYRSFGYTEMPVLVGLNLFMQIMSPVGEVLGLGMNSLTRKFEFEADAFAASLGKGEPLKSALVKISLSNLSSFEVDPLFHAFHHSHPTLLMRLRALGEMDKKTQ